MHMQQTGGVHLLEEIIEEEASYLPYLALPSIALNRDARLQNLHSATLHQAESAHSELDLSFEEGEEGQLAVEEGGDDGGPLQLESKRGAVAHSRGSSGSSSREADAVLEAVKAADQAVRALDAARC